MAGPGGQNPRLVWAIQPSWCPIAPPLGLGFDSMLMRFFGHHLLEHGLVSIPQLVEALDSQRRLTPPIGHIARDAGLLTVQQIYEIMNHQRQTGGRFLDTAVALGFLPSDEVAPLLTRQLASRPQLGEILSQAGVVTSTVILRELRAYQRTEAQGGSPATAND